MQDYGILNLKIYYLVYMIINLELKEAILELEKNYYLEPIKNFEIGQIRKFKKKDAQQYLPATAINTTNIFKSC